MMKGAMRHLFDLFKGGREKKATVAKHSIHMSIQKYQRPFDKEMKN